MKGLAHIGVLQALTERRLVPAQIVGSSVGALVGAAWSAGRSIAELRDVAVSLRRKDVFAVAHADMAFKRMRSPALFRREPLDLLIHRLVGDVTFQDLHHPLIVNTVDINSGMQVFWGLEGLDEVAVKDAVFASCALPGYLPPREIRGRFYVDGATVDNLPVGTARILGADVILAVDVSASNAFRADTQDEGFAAVFARATEIASGPGRRSTTSTRGSSISPPSRSTTCGSWWRKATAQLWPRSTGRRSGRHRPLPGCTPVGPSPSASRPSAASAAARASCRRRPGCSCSTRTGRPS
jgi:predicted acylesterase/phospholipase RssA